MLHKKSIDAISVLEDEVIEISNTAKVNYNPKRLV